MDTVLETSKFHRDVAADFRVQHIFKDQYIEEDGVAGAMSISKIPDQSEWKQCSLQQGVSFSVPVKTHST